MAYAVGAVASALSRSCGREPRARCPLQVFWLAMKPAAPMAGRYRQLTDAISPVHFAQHMVLLAIMIRSWPLPV